MTPEYNWTIPGTLKNALDWLSRVKDKPFDQKPVALQSAAVRRGLSVALFFPHAGHIDHLRIDRHVLAQTLDCLLGRAADRFDAQI